MAKIEMDISEYEALKENKRLLEKSLEKERELEKKVRKLNEEKIKALEEASKKVVIERVNKTIQTPLVKGSPKEFWTIVSSTMRYHARDRGGMVTRLYNMDYPEHVDKIEEWVKDITNRWFGVGEARQVNVEKEVSFIGMDDVKALMRDEISKDVQRDIDSLRYSVKTANEKLDSEVGRSERLRDVNKSLKKSLKSAEAKISDLERGISKQDAAREKLRLINSELQKVKLFNKGEIINQIRLILKANPHGKTA